MIIGQIFLCNSGADYLTTKTLCGVFLDLHHYRRVKRGSRRWPNPVLSDAPCMDEETCVHNFFLKYVKLCLIGAKLIIYSEMNQPCRTEDLFSEVLTKNSF